MACPEPRWCKCLAHFYPQQRWGSTPKRDVLRFLAPCLSLPKGKCRPSPWALWELRGGPPGAAGLPCGWSPVLTALIPVCLVAGKGLLAPNWCWGLAKAARAPLCPSSSPWLLCPSHHPARPQGLEN